MDCPRCNGCMIAEKAVIPKGQPSSNFYLMRCIQCGESIDSVILNNRLKQRSGSLLEEKVQEVRGRAKTPRGWLK